MGRREQAGQAAVLPSYALAIHPLGGTVSSYVPTSGEMEQAQLAAQALAQAMS